jgi:hypothetical protein
VLICVDVVVALQVAMMVMAAGAVVETAVVVVAVANGVAGAAEVVRLYIFLFSFCVCAYPCICICTCIGDRGGRGGFRGGGRGGGDRGGRGRGGRGRGGMGISFAFRKLCSGGCVSHLSRYCNPLHHTSVARCVRPRTPPVAALHPLLAAHLCPFRLAVLCILSL